MPKTLPAVIAVAIIAFSIGFNVARYPTVWEMAAPASVFPDAVNHTNAGTASQSTKPPNPVASISSENFVPKQSADNFREKQTDYKIPPIETDPPDHRSPGNGAIVLFPAAAGPDDSAAPVTNLVTVPDVTYTGDGECSPQQDAGIRRLPPVYQAAPIPSGRYAAEYPQAPIPIYPSTGVE